MINHIRTLFLNEDPTDADFVSASLSFPVDMSFRKMRLGGRLGELYGALMDGADGMDEKIARANLLYSAMSRVDLSGMVPIGDSRVTAFDVPDDGFDLLQVFERPGVGLVLFAKTGVESFDAALDWLKSCTSVDGAMAVSAGIAAYVIQLENERLHHG